MESEKIVYKIFRKENGMIKNLFRGIDGSRKIPLNKWLKADIKDGFDGSNRHMYKTGIHCLGNLDVAKEYLNNFKTHSDKVICRCVIRGFHIKTTKTRVPVLLAHNMKVLNEITT